MKDTIYRADAMAYPLSWKHYDKENGSREFICGVESYREYINALPSADAVSRDEYDQLEALFDAIQIYDSSAEAVQWIPCSERLPKRDELVLVTYKTTDRIHLCRYLDDGSENPWWSYIDDCCACNNVVLAWMPLPKPYKGGDSE